MKKPEYPYNYHTRESGLLLPFRALPGDGDYQGTLGAEAFEILQLMNSTGFRVFHDLPNTPPDDLDCPYSSVSAFAIDCQRIDLETLIAAGDLSRDELTKYQKQLATGLERPKMRQAKQELLTQAYLNFENSLDHERKARFAEWRDSEAEWLKPYATFEILKNLSENKGKTWENWKIGKDYSPQLVADCKNKHGQEFNAICYEQWIAEEQTMNFLDIAQQQGVEIWGDVPFYVGDGEVWANRDIFNLNAYGKKLNVGGAAPSQTATKGQKWGNATYVFDPLNRPLQTAKTLTWWEKRLARALKLNRGKVRLDHFIGLAEPYIIAAEAIDGAEGWREDGVGDALLGQLVKRYGADLPFYPEDLGTMTERTPELRDKYNLLRTALGVRAITRDLIPGNYEQSQHNPSNYIQGTAAFSGNHDSPALKDAIDDVRARSPQALEYFVGYLNERFPGAEVNEHTSSADLARLKMEYIAGSVGRYAFFAVWDVIGAELPGHYYNKPGTVGPNNWAWRMDSTHVKAFKSRMAYWLALNKSSGRA